MLVITSENIYNAGKDKIMAKIPLTEIVGTTK